ncbi:MAG: XrtA/PEP-CTERM system-associated ATPase [Promethearchaeota archaeon]|jgi:general secretion pathway protein A
MYENFYGLKEKPFSIVPNPDFLYLSEKHQNALTYLEYGLSEKVGFILLTGEIGTGKTTLIRHLLNQIESDLEIAVILNTNVSPEQLLNLILNEFELETEDVDKSIALDRFNRFLIDKYAAGKRVILIIDEAQNLSNESLEEIRMLSNLDTEDQILLQIMLVGQPELKDRLGDPRLSQISQRIAVRYHLDPLSREETKQYIKFRLQKAGGNPDIFSVSAVDLIYNASKGIPRTINLICDAALVYGFADEIRIIDPDVIELVIDDKSGIGITVDAGNKTSSVAEMPEEGGFEEILKRLQLLESRMQKLQLQVEWQITELEKKANGFKEELRDGLNRLLDFERKRSDKLLIRYAKLKESHDSLLKKIDEKGQSNP